MDLASAGSTIRRQSSLRARVASLQRDSSAARSTHPRYAANSLRRLCRRSCCPSRINASVQIARYSSRSRPCWYSASATVSCFRSTWPHSSFNRSGKSVSMLPPPRRGIPGRELTQTSFVGLEDLLLVKEVNRSRCLVRHDSNAAEASAAMRRMVIRKCHDFKAFPQEIAEAFHGEHGGLIGRRCSSNIHTYEEGPVRVQDPPHLLQGEARIRHMIERVTAYDEIRAAVQQGKIFRSQRQMDGSAADFIFDEHSELLVDVQQSEEHTSELQSPCNLVCRLLLEKKNNNAWACWSQRRNRSCWSRFRFWFRR